MFNRQTCVLCTAMVLLLGAGCLGGEVTYESLLLEMVDRDAAPRRAEPWFSCAQVSSYDRQSVAPDKPGWFANDDKRNFIREETRDGRREQVMMDVKGPGAIVRIWMTASGGFSNGPLRIYLDDAETPAFAGPALDLVSGGMLAPASLSFRAPELEDKVRTGHDLYLPIPYGRSCKVTYETKGGYSDGNIKESFYYHINYRSYASGTEVQTLTPEIMRRGAAVLERVDGLLSTLAPPFAAEGQTKNIHQTELAPLDEQVLTFDQGGAIYGLRCKLSAGDIAQALRSTVLKINFDGEDTVWAPVGDFFGAGAHPGPWRTWWSGVDADGTMSCYWVMPFAREAKITVVNMCRQPVTLELLEASVKPYDWTEATMYFHGAWHLYYRFKTGARIGADMNYVNIDGAGKYMGDALSIFNGGYYWWGEGDEKIYVDGEHFPSHFGTGTEDYYGYAWCMPDYYTTAFIAQPTGVGNKQTGYSVNNRFRLLDTIPFKKSLRFDMELFSHTGGTFNFAPMTWWYAGPGAKTNITPDRQVCYRIDLLEDDILEKPQGYHHRGAIECEDSPHIAVTGGSTSVQTSDRYRWSCDRQVWWQDGKPGDKLTLTFDIERADVYDLSVFFTQAPDYAIADLAINGRTLRSDVDFYAENVKSARLDFDDVPLIKGVNTLEATIKGANEQAEKRYMLGLDCLLLKL